MGVSKRIGFISNHTEGMNTHKLVGVWFGSSKRQAFQVLRMVKHSLKVSERKVLYWFKRKKAKLIELLFNVDPRSGWSLFKLGNNWGSTQVQSSKGSRSGKARSWSKGETIIKDGGST